MTTPRPLSTAIRNEVLAACRTALHYRGDLKSLMLGAGVPAADDHHPAHMAWNREKLSRKASLEKGGMG